MASKKKGTTRKRAASAPKPKHVSIEIGQRLHVHLTKGGKQVGEYIAGTSEEGQFNAYAAPEAPAPVATPDPISGT
jgi:hypothetical protein